MRQEREGERERGRERKERAGRRETRFRREERDGKRERDIGFRTEERAFTIEKKEIDKKRER